MSDPYIVVKGRIAGAAGHAVIWKNCSPFIDCITELDRSQLSFRIDLITPMYDLRIVF